MIQKATQKQLNPKSDMYLNLLYKYLLDPRIEDPSILKPLSQTDPNDEYIEYLLFYFVIPTVVHSL